MYTYLLDSQVQIVHAKQQKILCRKEITPYNMEKFQYWFLRFNTNHEFEYIPIL